MTARILALVRVDMLPGEAAEAVAAEREHLDGLDRKKRAYFRKTFGEMGYTPGVLDILFPKGRPGRAPGPEKDMARWEGLTGPVRAKLCDALGEEAIPTDPAWWTEERASAAADCIASHYSTNVSSQVAGLTKLRVGLKLIGAARPVIEATKRPEITEARNSASAVALGEAITRGIDFPPPYSSLADFVARVEGYLAQPPAEWDPLASADMGGQVVADWFVAFVARPGELETFELGPNGGIVGALKKRGKIDEWPIASAIEETKAREFFRWWAAVPAGRRGTARKALARLLRRWTDERRASRAAAGKIDDAANYTESTLRKIGTDLACQAQRPNNLGQTLDIARAALRHAPTKPTALDHYLRMNRQEEKGEASEEPAPPTSMLIELPGMPSVQGLTLGPVLSALVAVAAKFSPEKLAALLQVAKSMAQ